MKDHRIALFAPVGFVIASLVSGSSLEAQTMTALKTSERTTGSTKQCYYNGAGKEYTKTVESYQLCPMSITVGTPLPTPSPSSAPSSVGSTAFKTGENQTGATKECFYEFAGKRYTKTVEGYQLCPLSIRVP